MGKGSNCAIGRGNLIASGSLKLCSGNPFQGFSGVSLTESAQQQRAEQHWEKVSEE